MDVPAAANILGTLGAVSHDHTLPALALPLISPV